MANKLIIFDWDGTLVDSVQTIVGSLRSAAERLQLPVLSDQEYSHIIGLGMREAIDALYPGLNASQVNDYRSAYAEAFFAQPTTEKHLFEGVVEGLGELERRGYVLAVATGKSRNGLDKAMQSTGLRRYFPWHQCADETASKPDPLMLNNILAGAQCSVSDAVMVGDTIYDMEMARRIGMTAFGVEYGVHSADQLLGSGARATFSTFCELIDSLLVH